ncbi:hypothetical protein BH11ARM2_BH11ARM2_38870 [soil metagenome]
MPFPLVSLCMADEDPFEKIRRELEGMDVSEETEEKLLRLGNPDAVKAPDLPQVDEYDDRFAALHAKTESARQKREQETREVNRRITADQENYRGLGFGLQLAYAIIGMPLLGFGIGWLLDKSLGGDGWRPIMTLLGAVLGIGYAVWQLNRQNRSM